MLALPNIHGFDTTPLVPIVWTLGDVVRKLRDERGWSQAKLAEMAGVGRTTILDLEARPANAEQNTIVGVAGALKVSVADLYSYADVLSVSTSDREALLVWWELLEGEQASLMQSAKQILANRKARESAQQPAVPEDQTGTHGQLPTKARKA